MVDLWYYGTYLYAILIFSLAIYLAQKDKHTIIKIILIITIILFIFDLVNYIGIIPYAYFIFLFFRWTYKKLKKDKKV